MCVARAWRRRLEEHSIRAIIRVVHARACTHALCRASHSDKEVVATLPHTLPKLISGFDRERIELAHVC